MTLMFAPLLRVGIALFLSDFNSYLKFSPFTFADKVEGRVRPFNLRAGRVAYSKVEYT